MQQFVDLVNDGSMSPGILGWIEDDVTTQFSTGQAAMMINSASYVNLLRNEFPDLKWSLALLPEDVERATFLSAENLTITTGAQQADAAWDLMLWLQEPEVLKEYLPERNKLPALRNVAADPQWADDPVWSVFIEQLEAPGRRPATWRPTPPRSSPTSRRRCRPPSAVTARSMTPWPRRRARSTECWAAKGCLATKHGDRYGRHADASGRLPGHRPLAQLLPNRQGRLGAPRGVVPSIAFSADARWAIPALGEYLFVLPAVIFILATVLYPLLYTVNLSLHDVSIRNFLAGTAPFIGLDNYRDALADPALQRAFSVSLLYTGGSLALTFVFGFAFAVLFNRVFPGAGPHARAPDPAGLDPALGRQRQHLALDAGWQQRRRQLRLAAAGDHRAVRSSG